jgi:hypothetical protein
VRAAKEAETVLAEEAVLMVEALAYVALVTTIVTADATADNKQQSTTGSRGKALSGGGNGRGVVVVVETAVAAAAATQQRQRK